MKLLPRLVYKRTASGEVGGGVYGMRMNRLGRRSTAASPRLYIPHRDFFNQKSPFLPRLTKLDSDALQIMPGPKLSLSVLMY